ncbi:MAG: hypothetical protein KME10_07870 [Plectolyngbya sp. WJT66-NPBG17]|nr:hypothetical protein [Plectolyngbya sp. WJT66-NPBG17]
MEWVARTVQAPQQTEPHETDPTLRYALARIPEYGIECYELSTMELQNLGGLSRLTSIAHNGISYESTF